MRHALPLSLTLAALVGVPACNDAPTGLQLALAPETPTTEDDLELTLATPAVDAQGDEIRYEIAWTVDGAPSATHEGLLRISGAGTAKGQVWEATVTPIDDQDEAGEAASIAVTVVNTPPRGAELVVSPAVATTTDDVSVAVSGQEDPDDDPLSLSYAWSVDGVPSGTEAELPASNFQKGQQVQVVVTVADDESETAFTSTALTIGNTPPTLSQVQATPPSPRVDEPIACAPVDGADIDEDPLSYRYRWYVDGRELPDQTGAELTTGFAKEQIIACEVTISDGEADGPTVRSNDVTAVNSLPELASVTVSPAEPTTVDDLTARVSRVTNADDDAVVLTYRWFVNGTRVLSDVSIELTSTLPADTFLRDDEVRVEVSGDDGDGDGDGDRAIDSVTIANTAPVVTGVFLDPNPSFTDVDLVAVVNSSDIDGDPLTHTFTWYVNSVAQTETGDTLSSSAYERGDDIDVDVEADDGDLTSAAVSATTLTISNAPPSTPVIELTPTRPTSSDDLECEVTTASTDKDMDSITYSTTWVRDGTDFRTVTSSSTSVTLSASDVDDGDEWSCEVFATDGSDDSATVVSATVDVVDGAGL